MTCKPSAALIISSNPMASGQMEILGTGGWIEARDRELLDWLTLVKFMGWNSRVVHAEHLSKHDLDRQDFQYIIIADEPNSINAACQRSLLEKVRTTPTLLVARMGKDPNYLTHLLGVQRVAAQYRGPYISWTGPGKSRTWQRRRKTNIAGLALHGEGVPWTMINKQTILAGMHYGQGWIALLSFHPSELRDEEGCFSALLKHLLIWGANAPTTWLDWSNTLVLRMDDPGSAQRIYDEKYNHLNLGKDVWKNVGKILEENQAKLSVGYVPGWVDDGDSEHGQLFVDGRRAIRIPGKIHRSSEVKYLKHIGCQTLCFDYQEECDAIKELMAAGTVDVELHGYTHMHPDRIGWSHAPDRYTATRWYREFSKSAVQYIKERPNEAHPLNSGLEAFQSTFGILPSTLICPGDEFTNDVVEEAGKTGLKMISSYYQCLRIDRKWCWTQHVCAPYLDQANASWFDSELPVIGYFHDFDLATHGTGWLHQRLAEWKEAGVSSFITLGEMAVRIRGALGIERQGNKLLLGWHGEENIELPHHTAIGIRWNQHESPGYIGFEGSNSKRSLRIRRYDTSTAYVYLA